LFHLDVVVFVESEERVVGDGTELVASGAEESESGSFSEEISEPDPTERQRGIEKIDNDASEIDVRDDDEIELAEELEFLHVAESLSVNLRGLLEMLDGPNDRHENGSAADDINETEDVLPSEPALSARSGLFDDDESNVVENLERNDDEEDLLVLVREERLDEGPACADERDDDEHHDSLEEREDVIDGSPTSCIAEQLQIVQLDRLEQNRQRLQNDEHRHQIVHGVDTLVLSTHEAKDPRDHQRRIQNKQ